MTRWATYQISLRSDMQRHFLNNSPIHLISLYYDHLAFDLFIRVEGDE
jgi:hypothetical protein